MCGLLISQRQTATLHLKKDGMKLEMEQRSTTQTQNYSHMHENKDYFSVFQPEGKKRIKNHNYCQINFK